MTTDWLQVIGQYFDFLVWGIVFVASLWAVISESKRYQLEKKYDKLEWEYQCLAERFEVEIQERSKLNKTAAKR